MAGFDRSKFNLGRRTQQQTDTMDEKGGGGSNRPRFMDYSTTKLKFFKLGKVGDYHDINILPWTIATKNHPDVIRTKDLPEFLKDGTRNPDKVRVGDPDYVLDVKVHTRIGPDEGDYLCLKENFGKPCPICDLVKELYDKGDKDSKAQAGALRAKRKCVYLIQELDSKMRPVSEEPEIFEVSHFNFSKELQSRATTCMRGEGVVNFANLDDEGRIVSFVVGEGTLEGGKTYKKASDLSFNVRKEEISDEILEKCPSLDALMVIPTADKLRAALNGDPDDDVIEQGANVVDETPRQSPSRRNPEESRRREEPEEEPAPRRAEPVEPPARRREPEPEAEAQVTRRRAPEPESEDQCPNGYVWGEDNDTKPLCFRCPDAIFGKCQRAKR